jgi:hypothetical protein
MLSLFLAFFMALICPKHTGATHDNCAQVTTLDDTGGENGHIPPKPPSHPPTNP